MLIIFIKYGKLMLDISRKANLMNDLHSNMHDTESVRYSHGGLYFISSLNIIGKSSRLGNIIDFNVILDFDILSEEVRKMIHVLFGMMLIELKADTIAKCGHDITKIVFHLA